MPAIGEQTNRPITVRTRRRRRPPTRQEQASRAAETYYASQGRSVERQANRATSRQIMQGTREPPVPASRRGPLRITNERAWRAAGGVNLRDAQRQASEQRAARLAPGLAILNQLSRPVHGVAAGTRAAIHGRNVPRAALRGVKLKDKSLFSDVLRDLGVRGPAASIGGFGLDVALDPTTYLSFGAGSVARKGITAAGRRTGAEKVAEKARGTLPIRLARQVNPNIRPAGVMPEHFREVRDALRRGRAITATGEKRARTVAQGIARKLPGDTHPQITDALEAAGRPRETVQRETVQRIPADTQKVGQAEHRVRQAESIQADAAQAFAAERHHVTQGQELRQRLLGQGKSVHPIEGRLIDAGARLKRREAELMQASDALKKARAELHAASRPGTKIVQTTEHRAAEDHATELLNPDERKVAKFLQAEYDRMHGEEHAAGLVGPKFPEFGYSPRRPQSELEREGSRKRLSGAQLASSKARTNRRPYSEFRGGEHDIYTENAPLAYYLRGRDSAVKLGRNEVIQTLHRVGRVWHPGAHIGPGEEVYKFAPRRMPSRVDDDELKSLLRGGAPAGRNEYRILHRDLVGTAEQSVPQRLEGLDDFFKTWDRGQGKIKTALTVPNPQYHLTNLYGDLFNAYHGSNVVSLARSLGVSGRVLKHKAKREAALKTLDRQVDPAGKGIKIGGDRVSVAELLDEAERHGAVGQGFIGRDLADVLDAQGKEAAERLGRGKVTKRLGETGRKVGTGKITGRLAHPIDTIRDISQYREDAVRLATYVSARRRGMTPDAASAHVARHHFDYADLTTLERTLLRRFLPFYTFTARNTPLQIRTLFEKPGKFANLEKIREEAQKSSDVPAGYEKDLRLFEQQGLPVPVPGTGQLLYPKLPAMDLSRLTVRDQGNYLMAMLTPILKTPMELSQNYNFFFRQPIDELLNAPGPHGETVRTLKPAPGWLINAVRKIPAGQGDALLRDLHVRKYTDKTTGKRVWGWPAKLDYILKQTPASGVALQLGTGLPTSRGQTTGQKVLGYGTGLKVAPFSTPQIREQRAQKAYSYLQARAKQMRHDGDAYRPDGTRTRPYQQVLDQTRAVETVLGIRGPKRKRPSNLSPAAAAAVQSLGGGGGSSLSPAAQAALDSLRP